MEWMIFIGSIVIGAMIGGVTNTIAIMMLFRPYRTIRLGKWTLPFTPGLIPKRQAEIAIQLGKLVEQHLFTIDSLQQKLGLPSFQNEVQQWLQVEVEKGFMSDRTLVDILQAYFPQSGEQIIQRIETFIQKLIKDKMMEWWRENEGKRVEEIVALDHQWLEEKVAEWSHQLILKGKEFLYSDEGERLLGEFIQKGLEQQGTLGSMFGIFLSTEKLVDKLRPVLLNWLSHPDTKEKIIEKLHMLIVNIGRKELREFVSDEAMESVVERIQLEVHKHISLHTWFQQPLKNLLEPLKKPIFAMVPGFVSTLSSYIRQQLPMLYQQLDIAEMVRQQVISFPLPKLEKMVRELANRELAMITWLGALLGALFGLFQATLYLFLM